MYERVFEEGATLTALYKGGWVEKEAEWAGGDLVLPLISGARDIRVNVLGSRTCVINRVVVPAGMQVARLLLNNLTCDRLEGDAIELHLQLADFTSANPIPGTVLRVFADSDALCKIEGPLLNVEFLDLSASAEGGAGLARIFPNVQTYHALHIPDPSFTKLRALHLHYVTSAAQIEAILPALPALRVVYIESTRTVYPWKLEMHRFMPVLFAAGEPFVAATVRRGMLVRVRAFLLWVLDKAGLKKDMIRMIVMRV